MRESLAVPCPGSEFVTSEIAKKYGAWIAVAAIALLCAVIRFHNIGGASLWTDEIVSRYYSEVFDLRFQLGKGLVIEPTPPTYTLLLKGWMHWFGYSEAAMRALSAVACVLSVPVIYLLGRELAGGAQGLLAALLFALSPASVYFGQEARVYALYTLVVSIVLLSVAILLKEPRSKKGAATYLVFAGLCPYLHATGVIFLLACAGAVGLTWWREKQSRRYLPRWVALNALVLMLASPYLVHTLQASHAGGLDWMPPFSIHELASCLSAVISGLSTPRPWPGTIFAALLLVTLAVSIYRRPLSTRANTTLIGLPILFVILVSVVSLRRPILLPRTLLWTLVPLCLVAAIAALEAGRMRYASLLCLSAVFGTGLYFQVTSGGADKEPWREAVGQFSSQLEHADLVIVAPSSDPMVLAYYDGRVRNVRLWDASLPPTIMNAFADRLHIEPISRQQIEEAIRAHRSVWVVANGFDEKYIKSLRNEPPPTVYRNWQCGGTSCVTVAGWEPLVASSK
jgi:mannosyltransferase